MTKPRITDFLQRKVNYINMLKLRTILPKAIAGYFLTEQPHEAVARGKYSLSQDVPHPKKMRKLRAWPVLTLKQAFSLSGCLARLLVQSVAGFQRHITTSSLRSSDELNVHRDSSDNNANTPFEFTEANMMRLAALIQNYPEGSQRSVVGAALDIAQRQIGWVPISAMHKVAEILSVPRVRVYEYATFYTMNKRHFRGKYHVKICATTPCMLRGSEIILRAAEEACCCCVGSVSGDGMFGVDTVECAGACVNAPVMVIDDDYYEDLTVCDVNNIIQTIRCGGIPPAGPQNGRFACEPICGLTSLCECPPPPGFGLQKALYDK